MVTNNFVGRYAFIWIHCKCDLFVLGFPLNSKMKREALERLEVLVSKALVSELSGEYLPLREIPALERERLVKQHLLFEECDR